MDKGNAIEITAKLILNTLVLQLSSHSLARSITLQNISIYKLISIYLLQQKDTI